MSQGSCTSCKQIYNYPSEEELLSEHVEEEFLYEGEESSETGTELSGETYLSSSKMADSDYDGKNLVPELEDLYVKDDRAKELIFDETLFFINRNTLKKIGSMKITVEQRDNEELYVMTHYFFSKRTKMYEVYNYGFVRDNFKSTHEVRYEIELDIMRKQRRVHSLYVRLKEDKYIMTEQYKYDMAHFVKNRTELNEEDFLNVITETANVIIMRQIAKEDFKGFKFVKSIITNREICETQFKCYPFEWCRVNNKKTELKRIRKRIILPTKEMQESNAYLTRNGQLALVTWTGGEHYAIIDHRAVITPGYHPKDPHNLRPMMTRYLGTPEVKRKIEMDTNRLVLKSKNYIADHPEVMAIISFICKQILLTKPHKVIMFVKRCILPYL